jgi:hypothetical protein
VFVQDNSEVRNHIDTLCQLVLPFLWVYLECEVDLQEYLYQQTQLQSNTITLSKNQTQTLQNTVEKDSQNKLENQEKSNESKHSQLSLVETSSVINNENTLKSNSNNVSKFDNSDIQEATKQNFSFQIKRPPSKPTKIYFQDFLKNVELNVYYALECFLRNGLKVIQNFTIISIIFSFISFWYTI